jgi:hypothetical protein
MSAVQAGGAKGSGQKPGGTAGGRPAPGAKPAPGTKSSSPKPSTATRGANGAGKTPGRRPGPATKPGSGGAGRPGAAPRGGGKASASRTSGYRPGVKAPQRFSPSTIAFVAIAVVVVIVVAFVVVKVTGSNKPSAGKGGTPPAPIGPAPASLVSQVTSVPVSVASAVGLPTSVVNPPTVKTGQPKLVISGKPGAVFVGGEFCPLCAAERWAIIMAFGKFGTFTNLKETTSSPWDSYPSTPTFSFYGSTYTSPYITLNAVEYDGNDVDGLDTHTQLVPLTKQEAGLWQKYDQSSGFPFLDIGNKALVTSPSYDPTVLSGLDQADVASRLRNPKDPITTAIVGTANYLTAGICATTGQQPASVCSAAIVVKAEKTMGLT